MGSDFCLIVVPIDVISYYYADSVVRLKKKNFEFDDTIVYNICIRYERWNDITKVTRLMTII